jgi:hypothetical protein
MRPLFVLAGFAGLVGCGSSMAADDENIPATYDCTKETRADTFSDGLPKVGDAQALDFKLMTAVPAPPARGDNTWTVQINAMSSGVVGAGVVGATMTATPFMPDHQHGSPIEVVITDKGGGLYELSPVNLWMPGLWQTTIEVSGPTSDSVVYSFCLSQ